MRRLSLAILAITLVSISAISEVRPDPWENLQQLQPGHKIRLVETDLKSWDGKLVSVSDDTITIREKWRGQEMIFDRADVFRITDLQRTHRGRNALIGLAVGVAVGYAVTDPGEDYDRDIGVALFFAAPRAAIGALLPRPRPTHYRAKQLPQAAGSNQQR